MVLIGSDHAGYEAKENLKKYFKSIGISFKDLGTYSTESCDYPLIAKIVSLGVSKKEAEKAVLICGSGVGMAIAANKVRGVRAVVCSDETTAELSRKHNDANIICLGARIIDFEKIKKIVDIFLNTSFEGGRHQRRIDQISEIENLY